MKKDLALTDDKQRHAKLLECGRIIRESLNRGRQLSCDIGIQLQIIEDEKLYMDLGYQTLNEYAQREFIMDRFAVARCLGNARAAEILEQNNLRPPANESQLAELSRMPEEQMPAFWQRQLDEQERTQRPLTRDVIRQEVKKTQPAKRAGVKTALDEEGGDNGETTKAETKTRIKLTEEGEAALERIRRHAGDVYANAIEDMTVEISERDLRKWADQENWMIKKLGYYLIDQRWSLSQALKYEEKAISGDTTVFELVVMARFSQEPGKLDINFQDARIRVDIN